MPRKEQPPDPSALERHQSENLNDLIAEQVMHALGEPGDLLKVLIRPLWGNCYRANVFVGADAASGRVANSFFLTTDDDGNILESIPQITRQHADPKGGAAGPFGS
jgi:hypothetical protein